MLKFYGYKKCGTSRKAEKWLEGKGIAHTFIDITENPPPKTLLRRLLKGDRYKLSDLFNKSGGEYRAMKMKDKLPTLKPEVALDLLARTGKLCKRPMITDGKEATVGFDEKVFAGVWG